MKDRDERCAAREQATPEKPCWGKVAVFDSIGDDWEWYACEGHIDGMNIAGDPCDLTKYQERP